MTKSESSKGPSKADPKLQTIILKAFIHCEGCRRKIRRIIRVVDGVEDVLVESPAGKVTITGSNIDVKAVLQRLQKYGKQAEVLLPSAPAGPSASNASGGKQPKPPISNGSSGADASEKKKQNKAGEKGEAKPDAPINNQGKKGIGMKAEELPATEQGAERQNDGGPSGSKQAGGTRKEKPVEEMKETVNEAVTAPQGDGGNGGGGGKKGKKGGNGSSNGGGSGNGVGVEHLPPPPPPPHNVQDIPIASMPASRTVSVAANRAPAPYDYIQTGYLEYNNAVDYATDMFSDENANNCSIM